MPPVMRSANGSFSYRNWFPSDEEAPMRELVTQSIDELDEIAKKTSNMIELNRNGYLFVTRDPQKVEEFKRLGKKLGENGGGELRVHETGRALSGYRFSPEKIEYDLDGSDLLLGIDNIKRVFPSLRDSNAIGALHVRRCGSMNPFKLVCCICSILLACGGDGNQSNVVFLRIGQFRTHKSARILPECPNYTWQSDGRFRRWWVHQWSEDRVRRW